MVMMIHDVAVISLNSAEELIVASDNSGSIGEKMYDDINVPYTITAYYNFRVAYMECVAAGATPLAVVIHNFSGDEAWDSFVSGIKRAMQELHINLEITGSTETNFTLMQSAIGMVIIGRRPKQNTLDIDLCDDVEIAVIGQPLVGQDVIEQANMIAPLPLFQSMAQNKDVIALRPVGSKGILYELRKIFSDEKISFSSSVNMNVSSGPATCFVVVYKSKAAHDIKQQSSHLYHRVSVSM